MSAFTCSILPRNRVPPSPSVTLPPGAALLCRFKAAPAFAEPIKPPRQRLRTALFFIDHHHLPARGSPKISDFRGLSTMGVAKLGISGRKGSLLMVFQALCPVIRDLILPLISFSRFFVCVIPQISLQIYLCSVPFQLPFLLVSISGSVFALGLLDFSFKTLTLACHVRAINYPLYLLKILVDYQTSARFQWSFFRFNLLLWIRTGAPQICFKALKLWLATAVFLCSSAILTSNSHTLHCLVPVTQSRLPNSPETLCEGPKQPRLCANASSLFSSVGRFGLVGLNKRGFELTDRDSCGGLRRVSHGRVHASISRRFSLPGLAYFRKAETMHERIEIFNGKTPFRLPELSRVAVAAGLAALPSFQHRLPFNPL
ncbi:hypothetical protein C8R47DRAFT_1081917 [Mycena vitilis]|nr:hypothetical protein C8R47DRAFT_1081917 [Mycena vitilis]